MIFFSGFTIDVLQYLAIHSFKSKTQVSPKWVTHM